MTDPQATPDLRAEAAFLLDRLNDLGDDAFTENGTRDFYGHVRPSMARLKAALDRPAAPADAEIEGLVDRALEASFLTAAADGGSDVDRSQAVKTLETHHTALLQAIAAIQAERDALRKVVTDMTDMDARVAAAEARAERAEAIATRLRAEVTVEEVNHAQDAYNVGANGYFIDLEGMRAALEDFVKRRTKPWPSNNHDEITPAPSDGVQDPAPEAGGVDGPELAPDLVDLMLDAYHSRHNFVHRWREWGTSESERAQMARALAVARGGALASGQWPAPRPMSEEPGDAK